MRRLRAREQVVRRDHGQGKTFVFSLAPTETVQMKDETGIVGIYRVTGVSETAGGRITLELRSHAEARPATILRKIKGGRVFRTPNSLRESGGQKVLVIPLGEIRRVGRE